MDRTACTEPQCLYSRAIPLLPLWAVQPVQSLSACTVELYLYSPYGPYGLYRASVPVQGWPFTCHKRSGKGIILLRRKNYTGCSKRLCTWRLQYIRCRDFLMTLNWTNSVPSHSRHQPAATWMNTTDTVNRVKCLWWWAKTSPETCRAD
jgi:hypothetical protein